MRISEKQRFARSDARINHARAENIRHMDQLATQKRVTRISDDPSSLSKMFHLRDQVQVAGQYQKNLDYARGFITRSESSLQSIHENLIRAKELAIGMANDTYGPDSREASAKEIRVVSDSIKSLANSKFGDRYVFSGFRTATPPISDEGHYLGDDGEIFVQVGNNDFQRINVTARQLFEPAADDREQGNFAMIETLNVLYSGMMANDKFQIHRALTSLDEQLEKTSGFQATLGAVTNALDNAIQRNEVDHEISTDALSKIEDADFLAATSNFKRSESVLQSTLMASNKMLQPSLLNFMQ